MHWIIKIKLCCFSCTLLLTACTTVKHDEGPWFSKKIHDEMLGTNYCKIQYHGDFTRGFIMGITHSERVYPVIFNSPDGPSIGFEDSNHDPVDNILFRIDNGKPIKISTSKYPGSSQYQLQLPEMDFNEIHTGELGSEMNKIWANYQKTMRKIMSSGEGLSIDKTIDLINTMKKSKVLKARYADANLNKTGGTAYDYELGNSFVKAANECGL